MQIKKYANRRLYDTGTSRYVTLEEIAERVKAGEEISVVDAATGGDLTQATLTQIILESRGAAKLLPVPLLIQLVRLGDDALGEFFGRWVSWALEVYVHGRSGMQTLQQLNPFAGFPPGGGYPGAGGFPMGGWGWPYGGPTWDPSRGPVQSPAAAPPPAPPAPAGSPTAPANSVPAAPPPPAAEAAAPPAEDLAALRRELEELKAGMRKRGKKSS